jgi:general secretion pathway protein N
MMPSLRNNPLLGVLAALAIILAIVIGLEGEFGASVGSVLRPGDAKRAAPADAKLLPALVAVAPEVAYPETAARPLFTPTRRPAPEAPAAPQSTFQKGQFVLQGVIAVGDNRVAMLREKSSGRIIRVERGKEVNGIKVVDIQSETVTLAQGAEEEKLSLNVQKAPPALPAGSAQAAQTAAQAPQGPFAATPTPGVAAAAVPPGAPAAPPTAAVPLFGPRPVPVQPNASQPDGGVNPNPAARTATDAAAAPMTPEELLARRRARRTPQSQ